MGNLLHLNGRLGAVAVSVRQRISSKDLKELLHSLHQTIHSGYYTEDFPTYLQMAFSLEKTGYQSEGRIEVASDGCNLLGEPTSLYLNDPKFRDYVAIRREHHFSEMECWVLGRHFAGEEYLITSVFSDEGEHLQDEVEAWVKRRNIVVEIRR